MATQTLPLRCSGRARMVDVSAKTATQREAEASAFVVMKPAVLKALPQNPKGDPLEVARAGGDHGGQADVRTDPDVPPLALVAH